VCAVEGGQLSAELRLVPLAQIVGSEGRCGDFDRDFYPLHDHNRSRWLRIATARQKGIGLPPVDLVQVGDVYFVQDGHHRISVARAFGQADIEARVTVWRLRGSLPWVLPPRSGRPMSDKLRRLEGLASQLHRKVEAQARALRLAGGLSYHLFDTFRNDAIIEQSEARDRPPSVGTSCPSRFVTPAS
jgi:hypothetical protein